MKDQIYISGPIRNKPNKNQESFLYWQKFFEARNYLVITPFTLASPEEILMDESQITPEMCKHFAKRDCDAILTSQKVFFLRGWELSIGARAEHALAVWIQLRLQYE